MPKTRDLIIPDETLINKVYLIRGQKVILDRDLSDLYSVLPKRLREQVKRNISRFPKNFMFRLTKKETELMIAQNAIPSWRHLGGDLPYAFTEHGVLMAANVLKSDEAIRMSIRIIDIFVRMREILMTNKDILLQLEKLEQQVSANSEDIRNLFTTIRRLLVTPRPSMKKIGFKTA